MTHPARKKVMGTAEARENEKERDLELKAYALRAIFWATRYHCFTLLDRIAKRMSSSDLNCASLDGMLLIDFAALVANYDALRTL